MAKKVVRDITAPSREKRDKKIRQEFGPDAHVVGEGVPTAGRGSSAIDWNETEIEIPD